MLREDLSLDYDVGGLGVSATFVIVLASFVVAIAQVSVYMEIAHDWSAFSVPHELSEVFFFFSYPTRWRWYGWV